MPTYWTVQWCSWQNIGADLLSNKDTEEVSAQLVWACNGGLARLRGWSWVVLRLLAMWVGSETHVWGAYHRRDYKMTALVHPVVMAMSYT
jgi:hypothetical protein